MNSISTFNLLNPKKENIKENKFFFLIKIPSILILISTKVNSIKFRVVIKHLIILKVIAILMLSKILLLINNLTLRLITLILSRIVRVGMEHLIRLKYIRNLMYLSNNQFNIMGSK